MLEEPRCSTPVNIWSSRITLDLVETQSVSLFAEIKENHCAIDVTTTQRATKRGSLPPPNLQLLTPLRTYTKKMDSNKTSRRNLIVYSVTCSRPFGNHPCPMATLAPALAVSTPRSDTLPETSWRRSYHGVDHHARAKRTTLWKSMM